MVKKKLFSDINDQHSQSVQWHARKGMFTSGINGGYRNQYVQRIGQQQILSTPPRNTQEMNNSSGFDDTIEISQPLQSTARFRRSEDSNSHRSPNFILEVQEPRHDNSDKASQQQLLLNNMSQVHRSMSISLLDPQIFPSPSSSPPQNQSFYTTSLSFLNTQGVTSFSTDIHRVEQSKMIENNLQKMQVETDKKELDETVKEESPAERKVSRLLRNGIGKYVPEDRGMEVQNIRGSQFLCNNQNSLNISNTNRNSICFNQKRSISLLNKKKISSRQSGKENIQSIIKDAKIKPHLPRNITSTHLPQHQIKSTNMPQTQSHSNITHNKSTNENQAKLGQINKTRQIKKPPVHPRTPTNIPITKSELLNLHYRRFILDSGYINKQQPSPIFQIKSNIQENQRKLFQYTPENFPILCVQQQPLLICQQISKPYPYLEKSCSSYRQYLNLKITNLYMLSISILRKKECHQQKKKDVETQIIEMTPFDKLKEEIQGNQVDFNRKYEMDSSSKYQSVFEQIKSSKIRKRIQFEKLAQALSVRKNFNEKIINEKWEKDNSVPNIKQTKNHKDQSTDDKNSTNKIHHIKDGTFGQQQEEAPKISEFRISTYERPFIKKYKIVIDNYECGRLKWWWTKWKILLQNRYRGQVKFQRYTSFLQVNDALIRDLLQKQKKVAALFKDSKHISKYYDFKRNYSKSFMSDSKKNIDLETDSVLILPLRLKLPQGYDYFYQNYNGDRITKLVIFNEFAQVSYKEDVMIQQRNEEERDLRKKIRFDNEGIWIGCEMLKKKCEFMFFSTEERLMSFVEGNLTEDQISKKIIPLNIKDGKTYNVQYDPNVPIRIYGKIDWNMKKPTNKLSLLNPMAILFSMFLMLIIYLLL